LIFASTAFVLLLIGTIVFFQPFARRFEGKTVNQWLNYYSVNAGRPDAEVIAAFGTNAFPHWSLPASSLCG
jgi:hypothetical protein